MGSNKYDSPYEKLRLKIIENILPFSLNGGKVLDIGCGTGTFARICESKNYSRYIGVDIDIENVKTARKINKNRKIKTTFLSGDALKVCQSFESNCFDLILCLEFIEHVDFHYANKLLYELKKILKDNGFLILSTPNKYSLEGVRGMMLSKMFGYSWDAWDSTHKHIYSSFEIIRIAKRYFKTINTIGYYYSPAIESKISKFLCKIGFRNLISLLSSYWVKDNPLSYFGFNFILILKK